MSGTWQTVLYFVKGVKHIALDLHHALQLHPRCFFQKKTCFQDKNATRPRNKVKQVVNCLQVMEHLISKKLKSIFFSVECQSRFIQLVQVEVMLRVLSLFTMVSSCLSSFGQPGQMTCCLCHLVSYFDKPFGSICIKTFLIYLTISYN